MLLGFVIVPLGQLILERWISVYEYLIVLSCLGVVGVSPAESDE